MMHGFFSLLTTTTIFAFGIIGTITVINKTGHFLKNMEEEKKDSYKKAFDKFMIETIDEINFSIDSLKLISKHTLKNGKLLFDLASGSKCIKKDKDGNIIVSEKSKLTEEYKEKIEHLYTKLKKYQNEVKKYKNNDESKDNDKCKENDKNNDKNKDNDKNNDKNKDNDKNKEKDKDNDKNKEKDKDNDKNKYKDKNTEINDDSDDTISDDDSDDDTDELEYYLESDK
jgi:hypothetical protein